QFPFNSKKKRMTTVVKDDFGATTVYCKGASEIILEACDRYLDREGNVCNLSDEKKELFMAIINDMANQGNRTIGIAYFELEHDDDNNDLPTEEPDDEMIFMGVMGIQDPIRQEVPAAVLQCQSAGVVVRMVTGDNINTAIAIAKKCNILREEGWDHAMTGEAFRKMYKEDKAALLELLPKLRVLARSSPQDKYILVGLLQELGEVVGVTGDGTNDAPALKLADVGFAMQIGTDIAKGASDMVLLDNNFASVVNAIRWGRAVNDNIRKFLQFQLSINVAGVLLTLIGSLASSTSKEPFNPVMLLWLNLIMDTMAALALATERPEEACLKRDPVFKQ
ncbi:MAG: HAD-IC family P-type ATPase, partial [Flavobacteriaceae bacterium]|nr:HAD-IC family P-type ATPase [Flavobacteriaceae bacterium]